MNGEAGDLYVNDEDDCSTCGGVGVIEGDCDCMDDTCCCLNPSPPDCPECAMRARMNYRKPKASGANP